MNMPSKIGTRPIVRHLMAIVALMLFSSSAMATITNDREIRKDYPLTKLTDKVYVIHGPNEMPSPQNQGFRNNPVIVLTGKGVVVVDPGGSMYVGKMVVRKVRELTKDKIVAVFNTHVHGDHWLGNHGIKLFYPEARIYAHPDMKAGAKHGDGDMWVRALNQRTHGEAEGTRPVLPDTGVQDGQVLKFGDVSFKVYYAGKAHSDTDIMIELVEEKVFLFGDNVRNENTSPFMASLTGNLAAIETGLATGANVFVPGHGLSGDMKVVSRYRDFLLNLKGSVKKYYDQDMSDFQMKPKVIKDLAKYRRWAGFDENIGRLINSVYREVESESF